MKRYKAFFNFQSFNMELTKRKEKKTFERRLQEQKKKYKK